MEGILKKTFVHYWSHKPPKGLIAFAEEVIYVIGCNQERNDRFEVGQIYNWLHPMKWN